MVKAIGQVLIRNVSPTHFRYIVCRLVDGDLWYYTTWKTREAAEAAATEFENGLVVDLEEWHTEDPEKYGEYFITWRGRLGSKKFDYVEIAEYDCAWIVDHITERGYQDVEVIAWRELPEPFKGGEK